MALRSLFGLLAFCIPVLLLHAAERSLRIVDMGSYTVLTDVADNDAADWISEFDKFRRVAQEFLDINDKQLLPLKILLLHDEADFRNLAPTAGLGTGLEYMVLSVGLGQQPMIATNLVKKSKDTEGRIRGATVLWLMTSAGIPYDAWIVQGCIDFFGSMQLKAADIQISKLLDSHMKALERSGESALNPRFRLDSGPLEPAYAWVAVHYLLVGRDGWKGMTRLTDYQRKVMSGESREAAFMEVFGLSRAAAEQQIGAYLKRGRAVREKLPLPAETKQASLRWLPANAGLKDALRAQFMLQMSGTNPDLALEAMNRAAASMGNDVLLSEARWLYAKRTNEQSQAMEALRQAISLGTRNPVLREQWCIDVLNEQMLRKGTFLCDPDTARSAAKIIQELIEANPYNSTYYKLLAQFMATIDPVQDRDRVILESVQDTSTSSRELVGAGLAAWYWRKGDLAEAERRLKALREQPMTGPIAGAYAEWLDLQVGTSRALQAAWAALAEGDYKTAELEVTGIAATSLGNPALAAELRKVQLNLESHQIYLRAKDYAGRGKFDLAESLLRGLDQVSLTAELPAEIDGLMQELSAGRTD